VDAFFLAAYLCSAFCSFLRRPIRYNARTNIVATVYRRIAVMWKNSNRASDSITISRVKVFNFFSAEIPEVIHYNVITFEMFSMCTHKHFPWLFHSREKAFKVVRSVKYNYPLILISRNFEKRNSRNLSRTRLSYPISLFSSNFPTGFHYDAWVD